MLFLSFQSSTDVSNYNCGDQNINMMQPRYDSHTEKQNIYIEKLGYNPYWAIAINNLKDGWMSALMCEPAASCDFAFIFESDDYIRIDKVAWYNAIENCKSDGQNLCALDYISNEVDDIHSEFLVKSAEKIYYVVPMTAFYINPVSAIHLYFSQVFKNIDDKLYNMLIDYIKFVISTFNFDVIVTNADIIEGLQQQFVDDAKGRYLFILVLLPFFGRSALHLITEHRHLLNTYDLFRGSLNPERILSVGRNKFVEWCTTSCDKDEYDRFVQDLSNYYIDNDDVLTRIVHNKKIMPNECCPCGSGKKYKKCHGVKDLKFQFYDFI